MECSSWYRTPFLFRALFNIFLEHISQLFPFHFYFFTHTHYTQAHLVLLHFASLCSAGAVLFHSLKARLSASKMITTHFTATLALLWGSGAEPTVSPKSACSLKSHLTHLSPLPIPIPTSNLFQFLLLMSIVLNKMLLFLFLRFKKI